MTLKYDYKTGYNLKTKDYKTFHKEFINFLETLGYSRRSIHFLLTCVKEFLHFLELRAIVHITSITVAHIEAYYVYLQNRPNQTKGGGLSDSSIAGHLYSLRKFFKWLQETEILSINPISSLNVPYPAYNYRTSLSQEDILNLYKVTETYRDRAMLGLFYGCGLRKTEAKNINTEDIHLNEKLLIVREGKGSRRRIVPLAEKVKEDFENYYYKERSLYIRQSLIGKLGNAFMINNKGRRMTGDSFTPRLKYLVKKSEISRPVCLHQLRHSIATHLLEEGMRLEKVKEFLGHKRIDTTQKYTHVTPLKLL